MTKNSGCCATATTLPVVGVRAIIAERDCFLLYFSFLFIRLLFAVKIFLQAKFTADINSAQQDRSSGKALHAPSLAVVSSVGIFHWRLRQ